MGKASLWKPKLFRRFLSSLGGFPVDRGTADRESLRRCMQVIEDGELRPRQQNALLLSGAGAAPEALVTRVEAEGRELWHGAMSEL
jgi:hypothetical protein